jgi:hypothetical protein
VRPMTRTSSSARSISAKVPGSQVVSVMRDP